MKQTCRECGLLFHGGIRCIESKRDDQKECNRFAAGRPLRPYSRGRPIQEIEFDPEEPHAWMFWTGDDRVLLMFWEVDDNRYGAFKLQQIGLDHNGVVTKQFRNDGAPQPAFYGEVIVHGSGANSLYSSAGFEDEDQRDFEGTVLNKPGSVQIRPTRKDG